MILNNISLYIYIYIDQFVDQFQFFYLNLLEIFTKIYLIDFIIFKVSNS